MCLLPGFIVETHVLYCCFNSIFGKYLSGPPIRPTVARRVCLISMWKECVRDVVVLLSAADLDDPFIHDPLHQHSHHQSRHDATTASLSRDVTASTLMSPPASVRSLVDRHVSPLVSPSGGGGAQQLLLDDSGRKTSAAAVAAAVAQAMRTFPGDVIARPNQQHLETGDYTSG